MPAGPPPGCDLRHRRGAHLRPRHSWVPGDWFAALPDATLKTLTTKVLANDAIEQTVTTAAPTLTYSSGNARYQYVWKTDKKWANHCRQFRLTLNDGSVHVALFKFTR